MALRRTLTLAATGLVSIAILVVGTQPRVPRTLRRIPDWATHAATYAALAFMSARSATYLGVGRAALAGGAYAVGHGGLLELLQSAVPTRTAEWRDLLADALGAAAGAAAAAARRR
jgi:VanZ family protein